MRNYYLHRTILIVATLIAAIGIAKADTWDGSISTAWYENGEPYEIHSAADLAGLAQLVNGKDAPIWDRVDPVDFAGKKIVPFCTFGSGGLGASMKDLKQALPKAEILPGYGIRNARISKAPSEVKRFLIENRYLEGEVEQLPAYSAQQPVSPEEAAIFDAACGDYQYPLGTPVTVGKRTTSQGTDYCFTAQSKDAKGNEVEAAIYVTVSNDPNIKPEFTEVVR